LLGYGTRSLSRTGRCGTRIGTGCALDGEAAEQRVESAVAGNPFRRPYLPGVVRPAAPSRHSLSMAIHANHHPAINAQLRDGRRVKREGPMPQEARCRFMP
jgi:hypothetical protein